MNSAYLPFFFQLCRFGIVGLSAAALHFTIVVMLVQFAGIPPLIANIAGFFSGFQVSYWGHKFWTFKASDMLHSTAIPRLLLVQTFSFLANEFLFYLFISLHLPYTIALLIVLMIVPIFTFVFSKWWVFAADV